MVDKYYLNLRLTKTQSRHIVDSVKLESLLKIQIFFNILKMQKGQ